MKRYLGVGWWGTWRRCGCLDGGDGRSCGVCGWVRMGNSDPRKNKKSPLHITSRQRGLISLRNFPLKPISACSRPPLLWPSWHYLHWPLKSLVYTISIPSGANWILTDTQTEKLSHCRRHRCHSHLCWIWQKSQQSHQWQSSWWEQCHAKSFKGIGRRHRIQLWELA